MSTGDPAPTTALVTSSLRMSNSGSARSPRSHWRTQPPTAARAWRGAAAVGSRDNDRQTDTHLFFPNQAGAYRIHYRRRVDPDPPAGARAARPVRIARNAGPLPK